MPRKKQGIDWPRHQEVGRRLKEIRAYLNQLSTELSGSYGVSSTVAARAEKAIAGLDKLRCELDDIVCRDFPSLSDKEVVSVYYGANDQKISKTEV